MAECGSPGHRVSRRRIRCLRGRARRPPGPCDGVAAGHFPVSGASSRRFAATVHRNIAAGSHRSLRRPCCETSAPAPHQCLASREPARFRLDRGASLIERSLGTPASFPILRRRDSLAALAALQDVQAPRIDSIQTVSDFRRWIAEHGLPAMLKLDGTSGGEDIVPVYDPAKLGRAFLVMQLRCAGLGRLKRARRNRDVHLPFDYLNDGAPSISVQAHVRGRPANCAVACWRGDVLAATAVEAVCLQTTLGASSVVRVVEGSQMKAAARAIVRHLGISGMCGFDFMLDDTSGAAHLIEINPRATQVNHLRLGAGHDLPAALRLALEGLPQPVPAPGAEVDIALFPQEWSRDRNSPHLLGTGYDDVPYEEPELLRRYGYAARLSSPVLEASVETGMARLLRFVRRGNPRAQPTAR